MFFVFQVQVVMKVNVIVWGALNLIVSIECI
ncbi:hypothetical protein SHPE106448_10235 [Shewanella pealeana]